jgi:hypothetical protein
MTRILLTATAGLLLCLESASAQKNCRKGIPCGNTFGKHGMEFMNEPPAPDS